MKIVIQESTRKGKKFQATNGQKTVHFGDSNYQDFTQHKDEQRKKTTYQDTEKKITRFLMLCLQLS